MKKILCIYLFLVSFFCSLLTIQPNNKNNNSDEMNYSIFKSNDSVTISFTPPNLNPKDKKKQIRDVNGVLNDIKKSDVLEKFKETYSKVGCILITLKKK